MNKKAYQSPIAVMEQFEPLILEVQPGSDNGGEYQDGMDVDAPLRDGFEETDEKGSEWEAGLW